MRWLFYTCLAIFVISLAGAITTSVLYSQSDVKECALNCTVARDESNDKCYLVRPDNGIFVFPYQFNQTDEKVGDEKDCRKIDTLITCYFTNIIDEQGNPMVGRPSKSHVSITTNASDGKFYCFGGLMIGIILCSVVAGLLIIAPLIYYLIYKCLNSDRYEYKPLA